MLRPAFPYDLLYDRAGRKTTMVEETRRWLARRVWLIDGDGTKRRGSVWSVGDDYVQIRVDETPGVTVLPITGRGKRWDFLDLSIG
jgi:hypothetical protein